MPEVEKKKSMPQPPALRLLLRERTIIIAKPVDRTLMERVTSQLLVLDGKNAGKLITVYVNSPGGDADSGFAIYDAMRFVKAPIRTICSGLAASAAVPIFLGGRKGMRFSWPNSRFLLHQPSMQTMGAASDIEITSNEIERVREKYNHIVEEECGRAMAKVRTDTNRDFWLTATEAVEYGLVTRIVTRATELD
ncbi:MAG TPA: ATP-dependent Clp protease proteolytic subunit [Planctomycetota bacterium]|jgi:ATP-dependent Clp protease protease subunit|nr:ATP-dependent Clp protease proteolytic subunit [Planctomycetota bacterium]